ncbi:hypothetical protein GUITHDRAFT_154514 [Guillardia theta CCMP2712]|uniref:Uncharacterized protein n=1 Tax=Guillardia theta (strain CCMP2712) TaxID=905079 RepID=L1IS70_GUITC|nr:hypothetical protein GUITHDRAFT_154514 [Guillardia theta CCMP2712]EKX39116.1 hypothetical protein GUITHDRAFT_154514 [Guillardia theta CCMP2712]|eukprot:XP_005826096.1 hypothetical protein GUITHDRAFT_154514 [Guillardia theta CCMP2712]
MLQKNHTLLELNLWSNNLGAGGAAIIAMALSHTSAGLVDLDLGCNSIGNEGLTALAEVKRKKQGEGGSKQRWNEIDDEGVLHAGRTLAGTSCLKEMNLFGNKLSSDGKAQAELQRQVPSIKVMK